MIAKTFLCTVQFIHNTYDEYGKTGEYGVYFRTKEICNNKSQAKMLAIQRFRRRYRGVFHVETFNKNPFRYTTVKEIK